MQCSHLSSHRPCGEHRNLYGDPGTPLPYRCLFLFFTVHTIEAHYTYSLVPYDDWWGLVTGQALGDLLGWHRNQYDRAVHLLYGALMLRPAVEIFDKYAPPRGPWRRRPQARSWRCWSTGSRAQA